MNEKQEVTPLGREQPPLPSSKKLKKHGRMRLEHRWMVLLILTWALPQSPVGFPQAEVAHHHAPSRRCPLCPAGEYQKSCTECASCPAGSFTAQLNKDDRCRRCSGDCRADRNLRVIQPCTNTSDVKCVCDEGYTCSEMVPYSDNCRYCRKMQETTEADTATTITDKPGHNSLTSSVSGINAPPVNLCKSLMCGPQSGLLAAQNDTRSQTGKMAGMLPAVLACLFVGLSMALLVLVCMGRLRNRPRFKKALTSLMCSQEGRKASHKSKESTHHFPRDSFSAKQQLPPLSSANLGPVHVHNPGTIIFSLLSQFTGQVGPTFDLRSAAEMEAGDDRGCPAFPPAPSPGIHISEEERSQETDSIFFPFQEQGKDCHVSKEEVL